MPWNLEGTVLVACNCDYGCPCNYNARPTTGDCEGGWMWIVDKGSRDGVKLDGLALAVFADWPGAIHEGDADPKLLAYQYLQVLPQIARGESNKVWIIPSEFAQALGQLGGALGVGRPPDEE